MSPGSSEFAASTLARSSCNVGLNVVGVNSAMIEQLLTLIMLVLLKFFMKLGASVVCCNKSAELSESISRKNALLGNFFIPITFGGGPSCSGRVVFLMA